MITKWITTIDNPFDPFTQFDDWDTFDKDKGYNTCQYIARVADTSNELSESDYDEAVNYAVDDIARLNINGMYKRVTIKENQLTS
jgi:hypothetical protein